MNKRYGVWAQEKDGSRNGEWAPAFQYDKDYCERVARRNNEASPHRAYEVRELKDANS